MKNYAGSSTIYVSAKTGNDMFSGLSPVPDGLCDGPVATLAQAFSMIGQFRQDGITQPYTVKLMDEVTELSAPLCITARADARYKEAVPSDFTVEPYGDAPVSVVGGKRITGFVRDTFRGVACFSATVPEAWPFTDLYVDGDRADSTRYPAEGFFTPEDVSNHGSFLMDSSDWITVREGDIPADADLSGAVVSFGHYWIDEHTAVASYDPATRKMVLAAATRFTVAPEAGDAARMDYYIENLPYTFGHPNEWYFDRKAGKLYYVPRSAEQTPENIVVYAPVVGQLLEIRGTPDAPADGVRFRRIRFTCTKGEYESLGFPRNMGRPGSDGCGSGSTLYTPGKAYASDLQACSDMHGAISLSYAENCVFEECEIFAVGNHGIVMKDGSVGNRVERCHFHCLGAGAVTISGAIAGDGDPACQETHHNVVTDCMIEDGGRRHFSACGVSILHAHHNEISHNTIRDFFYSGISCGFVWGYHASNTHHNLLAFNHIYNLGKGRLSDMGGIYMLGTQKGSVIRGNVIHDVKCKVYGGWALYTDEGSSFITVEDNICYNCSSNCYHQHYGRNNVLRNNIFAFSGEALLVMGRREARLGLIVENNIFLTKNTAALCNCHSAMLSGDLNLFWNAGDGELIYRNSKEGNLAFENRVAVMGCDENSIVADPLFADAEHADFTLSPSSPALGLGFRPIDASAAGCSAER